MRATFTPEQRKRLEVVRDRLTVGTRGPTTTELLRAAVEVGVRRLESDETYTVAVASADACADWLAENGCRLQMSQLDALARLLWYLLLRNDGGVTGEVRRLLLSFDISEELALEAAGVTSVNIMEVT